MLRFVLTRAAGVILVVVVTAVVAFGGLRAIREGVGSDFLDATLHELDRALLHLQVGIETCQAGGPCATVHREWVLGWAVDVALLVSGLVIAPIAGLLAGTWAVGRDDQLLMSAFNAIGSVALSLPPYIAGYLTLLAFDGAFGLLALFPVSSSQITLGDPVAFARVLAAPALIVTLPGFAVCFRLTVAAAKEAAGEDYIRTAIAKGLSPQRALARHGRPAAAVAVVSFVASSVPFFVTNLVLLEYVLNVPGFFRDLVKAAGLPPNRAADFTPDYATLQGVAIWAALLVALVSAAADLVLYRLDPRVRARSA